VGGEVFCPFTRRGRSHQKRAGGKLVQGRSDLGRYKERDRRGSPSATKNRNWGPRAGERPNRDHENGWKTEKGTGGLWKRKSQRTGNTQRDNTPERGEKNWSRWIRKGFQGQKKPKREKLKPELQREGNAEGAPLEEGLVELPTTISVGYPD